MNKKTKLSAQIHALQLQAAEVCQACQQMSATVCEGPVCPDIVRIVSEIDPLVCEYFRLELVEKRVSAHADTAYRFWQRLLPLSALSAEARHTLGAVVMKRLREYPTDAGGDGAAQQDDEIDEGAQAAIDALLVPPNQKVLSYMWLAG